MEPRVLRYVYICKHRPPEREGWTASQPRLDLALFFYQLLPSSFFGFPCKIRDPFLLRRVKVIRYL